MLGSARGVIDEKQPACGFTQFCIGCCGCCGCSLMILLMTILACTSKAAPSNVTEKFVKQQLDGDAVYGWWSPPAPQPPSVLAELRKQLDRDTVLAPVGIHENMTFGFGSAATMARLLYSATKVEGVWEKVPQKLRGVFWMKGNGIGEELAVLQYGSWFEAEQMYITGLAPLSWAWAGGKPEQAPFDGAMYDFDVTLGSAFSILGNGDPATAMSYQFGPCPSGKFCKAGTADLTYADLQVHMRELTVNNIDMKSMLQSSLPVPAWFSLFTGKFTLEEIPDTIQPGSHWRRSITWGVEGCSCFDFGGYDLVKVIDGKGEPLQPAYDEFIKYMGDVDLFAWSGFKAGTTPHRPTRQLPRPTRG